MRTANRPIAIHTRLTTDKMSVANIIVAVNVVFAWLATNNASANHLMLRIIGFETHDKALVKDIELAFEIFVGVFFHIGHDPVFELIDIGEAMFH